MFTRKNARDKCAHQRIVTVRTAGIERNVCEACGKVSIQPLDGLSGTVERSQFKRDSEREHSSVA